MFVKLIRLFIQFSHYVGTVLFDLKHFNFLNTIYEEYVYVNANPRLFVSTSTFDVNILCDPHLQGSKIK